MLWPWSFRDGPKDQTSDVQLHIGESRDSGFASSTRPGMTLKSNARVPSLQHRGFPCFPLPSSLSTTAKIGVESGTHAAPNHCPPGNRRRNHMAYERNPNDP